MATIRLRLRWKFSPLWGKFIFSTLALAFLTLVALPARSVIDLHTVKTALATRIPALQSLPGAVSVEPPVIDLQPYNINFTTNIPLKLGLDIQGGTQVTLAADMESIAAAERGTALQSVEEVLRRRVDLFGVAEPKIQSVVLGDQYRIVVELPGIDQPESALQLIGQTAKLQFKSPSAETASLQALAVASEEAALRYIASFESTPLDGQKLQRATLTFDPQTQQPTVGLQFNDEGAALFADLTTKHVGQPLAIFLDDQPLSLPVVNEPIYGGQAVISGGFSLEAAQALVAQLNAGALPVSLSVVEQKTVGPSLGAASLQQSFIAGAFGLLLVMLFMILLYGWSGVIADVGLIAYAIVTLATYKLIPVTLTLPGVAGLVLSIGMAVDANILTFARIKEELRAGKSWPTALHNGFGRAWEAIKGANLATLAICFILFNPLNWGWLHTSGPVRGFALTLALGIVISLFTGVFYSRLLMQLFLAPPKSSATKERT